MYVIAERNVTRALPAGLRLLETHGERQPSRAGDVIVSPFPVTTVYWEPRERVLFSRVRDANPFFHLAESLWMLAGRDDAALLDKFVSDFGQRYAEEGGSIHDAYGYRWRRAFGVDQLDVVVEKLRADHNDRQAVIQMWDARPTVRLPDIFPDNEDEVGQNDLRGSWKTRPCNTHVYLRVRTQDNRVYRGHGDWDGAEEPVLDLTVCCRSNDVVWGTYGANAVHFSVLQEYLAARVGVAVGTMYQVSNNYHVYVDQLERLASRAVGAELHEAVRDDRYDAAGIRPARLVHDPTTFDEEVVAVLREEHDHRLPLSREYRNTFLTDTALTAFCALALHRRGEHALAIETARQIAAGDWAVACTEWLERRQRP